MIALGEGARICRKVSESSCVEMFLDHDGSHVRLADVRDRLVSARFASGEYPHRASEALAAHIAAQNK